MNKSEIIIFFLKKKDSKLQEHQLTNAKRPLLLNLPYGLYMASAQYHIARFSCFQLFPQFPSYKNYHQGHGK